MIAHDWLASSARTTNRTLNKASMECHENQYRKYHERSERLYKLFRIIMNNREPNEIS